MASTMLHDKCCNTMLQIGAPGGGTRREQGFQEIYKGFLLGEDLDVLH